MSSRTIENAIRLHEAGNLPAAEAVYRSLLKSQPDHPAATHYLGMILHQRGQSEQGLQMVRRSIASAGVADFHFNLAVILRDMERCDDAVAALCAAIRLRPRYPQALNSLGDNLRILGRNAEARAVLLQSIQIAPSAAALDHLAMVCINELDWPAAVSLCRQALQLDPTHSNAQKNLGRSLRGAGDFPGSVAAWQAAIALAPTDAQAWFGLADAQRAAGDMPGALVSYQRADALRPHWPELLNNFATALIETAQIDEAIGIGRDAVRKARKTPQSPASQVSRYNLSLALLCAGKFRQGWKFYESRWACEGFAGTLAPLAQPPWDGSDPAGKTILLRCEQGCGDAIQFVRYIPLLAAAGAKITLQCQPELTALLSLVPGVSRVISRQEDPGQFDMHLPLLSLPRLFKTTQQNIPADVPYLHPDPERRRQWARRLAALPGLKCGLVWAGNPLHPNDRNRSLSASLLAPLAAVPGVSFVSLQKNPPALPPLPGLHDISADLNNFADTAAALSQLDLLISADTSAAHLAGALALPVWTLIPFAPDWRWMLNTQTTAWYPTMRLFRQSTPGGWAAVLARVAAELNSHAARAAA